MTIQKNRLLYLDYIKALGICLVILYHCRYIPFDSMLIEGVYAICVPLFFVVNGYLMLRKEYTIRTLLKKNIKLLCVMFFWAVVSTIIYMHTVGYFSSENASIVEGGKWIVRSALFISKPECSHLWFLKALLVLNLLNPIIYKYIHNNNNGLYYLIVLLGLWSIGFLDIITCRLANPLVHWVTAFSVLYYLLGYALLNCQVPQMENYLSGKRGVWILGGIVVLCAFLQWGYNWIFTEGVLKSLNTEKGWIHDIVYDNYSAIFIVIMTVTICALFQRVNWRENKFWLFIGKNSLAIYVLQTPVQRLLQHWLPLQQLTNTHHSLGAILPVMTLLFCMLITQILLTNKYTKYLITI